MDDAWFIGPFLIQEKWAIYVISVIVSYFVLRVAVKRSVLDQAIIEDLWNGFLCFLIVWKLSYALFHPMSVLQNPISLLYFTGGDKGIILGIIAVILYFVWKSKRGSISFHHYMKFAIISGLAAIGTYRAIVWGYYLPSYLVSLFEALLPLLVVLFLLRNGSEKWVFGFLWFSLGELLFSYFKPEVAIFLGFSWKQLFYIIGAGICLVIVATNKRTDSA